MRPVYVMISKRLSCCVSLFVDLNTRVGPETIAEKMESDDIEFLAGIVCGFYKQLICTELFICTMGSCLYQIVSFLLLLSFNSPTLNTHFYLLLLLLENILILKRRGKLCTVCKKIRYLIFLCP